MPLLHHSELVMVYRKGELSSAAVDRGWPWQVAMEERYCTGHNFYKLRYFCAELSLCQRGHAFYRDGVFFNVFCFSEASHAEAFAERFGGELMHASKRPRWGRRGPRA